MFDSPHPVDHAPQLTNYIQPNLGYGLRIWWAFYWRTLLASMVLAVAVNLMLRRVEITPATVLIAKYDVYVFYLITAFFAMAYILRKNFRHFRIALLSNHGGEGAAPLTPMFRRTARVWWAFCWQSVVYRIIAAVAVMFPLGWVIGFLASVLPVAPINMILQFILDALVGMFVIYSSILDEDISDFRVGLIPRMTSPSRLPEAALPPDLPSPGQV
jgi:hypothetical protein